MKTPSRSRQRPSPTRAWTSSATVWSLLLIALASSTGGPLNAQASPPETPPRILATAAHLDDLLVTVAWPSSWADTELEIVVLDADQLPLATQSVRSIPGDRTATSFHRFFELLPEHGPQFFAAVRDADGSDLSRRHPWRGMLDCPDAAEPCRWATHDGLRTDALTVSQSLRTALDTFERSSDLLTDTLARRPDLRGSVFLLAAQLDQLDRRRALKSDCFCAWTHSFSHLPARPQCDYQGPGQLADGSGSEREVLEGPGAIVWVAGQARHSPSSLRALGTATNQQTLQLDCWKVHRWLEKVDLPLDHSPERPPQTLRFPVIEPCRNSCRGTVESSASLAYHLTTGVLDGPTDPALAVALVYGSVEQDSDAQPAQAVTWDAWLQGTPGPGLTSRNDFIRIPEVGTFLVADTRRVTSTLTGTAQVAIEAKEATAWSYGTATFSGGLLLMRGEAECALLPTRDAALETWIGEPDSDDCGEPLIEPWED